MKYLADSDWVVDYLIGKQQAIDLFSSVSQDGIAISLITFGEIYHDLTLLTHNRKHYERIPTLKVQFPAL